jgi:hypothetical protein
MRLLFGIAQVSAIGLLLVACSGAGEDTSTTELAATVTEEAPSDWIAYSDEASGFSISYPNDWEVFAVDEAVVADLLAGIEDALPGVNSGAVPFQAGLPVPGGAFNPNVGIGAEAIPDTASVDEFVEATKRVLELAFPSFVSTKQVKVVVGGRDLVLVHGSYELSDLDPSFDGRFWMIQGATVDGPVGWVVTCGRVEADASTGAPDLEECDTIVRTFELSNR